MLRPLPLVLPDVLGRPLLFLDSNGTIRVRALVDLVPVACSCLSHAYVKRLEIQLIKLGYHGTLLSSIQLKLLTSCRSNITRAFNFLDVFQLNYVYASHNKIRAP